MKFSFIIFFSFFIVACATSTNKSFTDLNLHQGSNEPKGLRIILYRLPGMANYLGGSRLYVNNKEAVHITNGMFSYVDLELNKKYSLVLEPNPGASVGTQFEVKPTKNEIVYLRLKTNNFLKEIEETSWGTVWLGKGKYTSFKSPSKKMKDGVSTFNFDIVLDEFAKKEIINNKLKYSTSKL